jgi:hypothetical protein
MHNSNMALSGREMHNARMPFSFVFTGFWGGVMVGAGSVFALLLAVGVGMPGRSVIPNSRRRIR